MMESQVSHEYLKKAKEELSEKGWAYIESLPEGFSHLDFAQKFGDLMPQYDGEEVWSIKADPKFDDHYHSLNTKGLSPHTECYEFDTVPPKYLALWCVKNATCGGGQTTLYDAKLSIADLDDSERDIVTNKKLAFNSSSGIQVSDLGRTAYNPIVEQRDNGKDIIRFSFNCIDTEGCSQTQAILSKLVHDFESKCERIEWVEGGFLIFDNHRVLHSRTSYEDRNRELTRVWISE